jgi:hypothetical protein
MLMNDWLQHIITSINDSTNKKLNADRTATITGHYTEPVISHPHNVCITIWNLSFSRLWVFQDFSKRLKQQFLLKHWHTPRYIIPQGHNINCLVLVFDLLSFPRVCQSKLCHQRSSSIRPSSEVIFISAFLQYKLMCINDEISRKAHVISWISYLIIVRSRWLPQYFIPRHL